jgi:rubrerythrin
MDFMSKTDRNLKAAVANESLARNRYSYFAIMAEKEGYRYIAKIFEEIAENEKYHAMEELKLLMGDRDTLTNLKESVDGEQYESEEMYPRYATEAEVEGNRAATILFQQISKIERQHYDRFKKLLEMVAAGKVFKRDAPIKWKCSICGYGYDGLEPPRRCPYCKRPQEYYEPANLDV